MEKLQKGVTYRMKVTSIKTKENPFFKKQEAYYKHDIYFEDEEGKKYTGEYIIQSPQQHDFRSGLKYEFHVTFEGQYGVEIQLGPSPTEVSNSKAFMESEIAEENVSHETKYVANRSMNMSGQSVTFAMAYSKDIYTSMIAAGYIPKEEVDDLDRMIVMAKRINAAMVEMQLNNAKQNNL